MKKTVVWLGFTYLSTHLDHVFKTLAYAAGRSISSYFVAPSSNDPRLFRSSQKGENKFQLHLLSKNTCFNIVLNASKIEMALTELSYQKCSSTICMC